VTKLEVINFFSSNYSCKKCFNNPHIINSGNTFEIADVSGPQPRWIGRDYFNSNQKVCIMLINPGSGDKTPENEWAPLKKLSEAGSQEKKEEHWSELMQTNENGMPKWGAWEDLYFGSLGLREKRHSTAFMNMMLCASKGNNYNTNSLDLCFSEHSSKLLKLLSPDILIFSGHQTIKNALKKPKKLIDLRNERGTKTREINSFLIKNTIKNCLKKNAKYFFMGHYAYIKSEDHQDARIIANSLN
jgi:hypothetical protein